MTQAFLWTDCRYYIEASEVLDENWILMKDGIQFINRFGRSSNINQMA